MAKYRLLKDLPTFKAGSEFFIPDCDGGLWLIDEYYEGSEPTGRICAYAKQTLEKFPNILKDWFEEIPEKPKTVWELEVGDKYWHIVNGGAEKSTWCEWSFEKSIRSIGSVFLTKEDAEREIARRKAKVILERDTGGFKPDWRDKSQYKCLVFYDSNDCCIKWAGSLLVNNVGGIYFATEEDAKESIRKHEKEWKIYLGVEEGEDG